MKRMAALSIAVCLIFVTVLVVYAAEVKNVTVKQTGNRMLCEYDLMGDEGIAEVNVTITVKSQAYASDKLHMEGDFGKVKPGNGKKIWWNVLQDFPRGVSDDVEWDVAAVRKEPIISKPIPSYPKPMRNEFSSAGSWRPNRPVQFIVPFAPGGLADIIARITAMSIEKDIRQPVVITNKPGAGGAIGAAYVVNSKADGYTLLFGGSGTSTDLIMPHFQESTLEASRALVPVCRIATNPIVLTVRSDSSFKTLRDVIAFSKNNPGKLRAVSAGATTGGEIILKAFGMSSGVVMQITAHVSTGEATGALVGGSVDCAALSLVTALSNIKANKLLPIAVASDQRSPLLPNTPTFQELGFGLANTTLNYGLAAPRGTSPEIIQFFAYMLYKACDNPEFIKKIGDMGMPIQYLGPRDFGQAVSAGFDEYGRLIRELGIKL